ncbi:MAG: MFS transporter [Cryobacterium sp.]|nr:MFS transporter [Cryobacterium sp.]
MTSEFLPTGLLPEMAEGLGVSQSRVGLLISFFAATVVVSATPLTALTTRLPRKPLVLVVLAVFAATNFIGAIAPTYEIMAASRILGGLAHGLFWAVVGAYPAHLVKRGQLARAIAVTSAGGSAAFVLGVPAGTALGHLLGWRLAFTTVGIAIVVLALLVLKLLPPVDHLKIETAELATIQPGPLLRDRTFPRVLLICLFILLMMIGHNLYYTYIVPYFTEVNRFPADAVSVLLLVYGISGAFGLLAVGMVGSKYPRAGLASSILLVALAVLAMGLMPQLPPVVIVVLVVWGAAFGGAPALFQTRVLQTASARIRDVSAALVTTAFNIGIGGGAFIGSLLLDGVGIAFLPFVDVAISLLCLMLVLVADVSKPRNRL